MILTASQRGGARQLAAHLLSTENDHVTVHEIKGFASSDLKRALVEAATSMLLISKKWCALKVWGIQLSDRVGKPKAIVAVARKLAIVMHRMWVTGDDFKFGEVPDALRIA